MKMKTVFLVLLAAALVLSLTGVAAAEESKVPINNKTLSTAEHKTVRVPVNITLNLEIKEYYSQENEKRALTA